MSNYGGPARDLVETIQVVLEGQHWAVFGQLTVDGDDAELRLEGDDPLNTQLVIEL